MTSPRKGKPSTKRPPRPAAADDDVGYGKPPRANQFKPGESGNPKGRPRGAKSAETILVELLQQKITLTERGRTRRITVLEGILRRIAEDCLKGNIKSSAFLLNRLQAMSSGETEESGLSDDEQTVLETYLKTFQSELNPKTDDLP
ncbi:MAG TPA: DUF5681 domain-containing protein [Bradyrhizobium sp.]|nr:DUF5681 domain-containing protein [Bradyrhizobium sp.]